VTRPLLGVVGYRPAVVARLDPRTLRALPGPRIGTVQLSGVRAGFQNPPDWGRPGAYGTTRAAGQVVASSDELLPYLLDDPGPAC
jgi:hypothetical protein